VGEGGDSHVWLRSCNQSRLKKGNRNPRTKEAEKSPQRRAARNRNLRTKEAENEEPQPQNKRG